VHAAAFRSAQQDAGGDEGATMIDDIMLEAEIKMDKAIEAAREELAGIRSGRATPGLLQRITIDYYGAPTPLQQLASISAPEPRLLVVSPYDRNSMAGIEKAIRNSDLGVNPNNDGQVIRLSFPPLTEERRKQLVKIVRSRAEEARVGIRNVRRHAKDGLSQLEKGGEISQDDERRAEHELQQLTDRHVAEVDSMLQHKEQELLEV
jgi:ribosome recycling factor